MGKLKGIDIVIISQFDIRKLPEYQPVMMPSPELRPTTPKIFGDKVKISPSALISCYVPILAGSQIWFEYSIDGPHAPEASYFFKLIVNGKTVTSWDCTAKHGYHGKMMYNLAYEGTNEETGIPVIKREALIFNPDTSPNNPSTKRLEDYVEIRIHRIEHRQRVELGITKKSTVRGNHKISETEKIRFTNSGAVEPHFRPRYYRYQLLDPIDQPYATFRFFYRTPEFLEKNGIVPSGSERSRASSASSIYHDAPNTSPARYDGSYQEELDNEMKRYSLLNHSLPALPEVDSESDRSSFESQCARSSLGRLADGCSIDTNSSHNSPGRATKMSLEEYPETRPDSTNSTTPLISADSSRPDTPLAQDIDQGNQSSSSSSTSTPTSTSSLSKRAFRKKLAINITNSNFEGLENRQRPLSPFTRGGFLRSRVQSPIPPSAPAALTLYGPSVQDEIEAKKALEQLTQKMRKQATSQRTTREQRNGKSLLAVLGRRIAKAQAQAQAQAVN